MVIYDFEGKTKCNNLYDLKQVLNHRSKHNSNEFELRANSGYPFLAILIKDEYACVHYFKDEDDCGHYAYVDDNRVVEEYVLFNMGTEDFKTEISKDLVISVEQAYIAAIEFFSTNKMTTMLKWQEL